MFWCSKKADIVNKKLNEDIQDVPNHTSESIHMTDKPITDTPQILFYWLSEYIFLIQKMYIYT